MRIEPYTEKRRDEIISLVKSFHEETYTLYGQKLELDALYASIEKLKHHAFLLIIEGKCVGVFAGFEVTTPISFSKAFHQVLWFVTKKHRSKSALFLKNIMKSLKAEGYVSLVVTLLHNLGYEKSASFFKRSGFHPLETHFLKQI